MPLHFSDLVKKRKIYFVSDGKTLDTKLKTYGHENQYLVKHIAKQVSGPLTIGGKELTHYLEEQKHMYELTDFLVGLLACSSHTTYAHVWADVMLLESHYPRPDEDVLENVAGTIRIDLSGWLPELLYCEKVWNLALCNAFGGFIGYPGYEWPMNEKEFSQRIVRHATHFVIGTPQQLIRYKAYGEFVDDEEQKNRLEHVLKLFGRP